MSEQKEQCKFCGSWKTYTPYLYKMMDYKLFDDIKDYRHEHVKFVICEDCGRVSVKEWKHRLWEVRRSE